MERKKRVVPGRSVRNVLKGITTIVRIVLNMQKSAEVVVVER